MTRAARVVNGIDLTAHGGLIGRIVGQYRRFIGGCLEWDDLFQAGWLGLHHAAERFDPERGTKFSTYANWWIRAFVQRAVADQRRTVRIPVHVQQEAYKRGERLPMDALSLDMPLDADNPTTTWIDVLTQSEDDPSATVEHSELVERVDAAVEALGEKARRIIRGRFWRDRTLGEIGVDMGVSRERVRQREADALARLERPLREADSV